MILRWLHRWRQRDDQHLVKRDAPETADPIDQLRRLVNEAQEQTNGGCIHGGTVQLRLEGLKNRLEQLRRATEQKGNDASRKHAEGDKFANWMEGRRKVEAIIVRIVRIAGAIGFDSCA
jgi:signal transduction histidine kinase